MNKVQINVESLKIATVTENNKVFLKSEFTDYSSKTKFMHPLTNQVCDSSVTHDKCNLNFGFLNPTTIILLPEILPIAVYLYHAANTDKTLSQEAYALQMRQKLTSSFFKVIPALLATVLVNSLFISTDYLPELDEVLEETPEQKCDILNHLSSITQTDDSLNSLITGRADYLDCHEA